MLPGRRAIVFWSERGAIENRERYTIRIKDLPEEDRPRERLVRVGERALSTAELLAISLRQGTVGENALRLAERLLVHFGGAEGLSRASIEELMRVKGIGPAKAAQITVAMELWRRLATTPEEEHLKVTSPADAANLLLPEMGQLAEEEARALYLSTRNDVLGMETVLTAGWTNPSQVVRNVFEPAIRLNAAALVLAHNHLQDEELTPSAEDVEITRELVRAGKLLDIELLDHLIIQDQQYQSLKEDGIGFG